MARANFRRLITGNTHTVQLPDPGEKETRHPFMFKVFPIIAFLLGKADGRNPKNRLPSGVACIDKFEFGDGFLFCPLAPSYQSKPPRADPFGDEYRYL